MLFAVPAGGGRKPAQASSDTDLLNAESKKFVDYARDFLAMETAYVDERLDSDIVGPSTRSPTTIRSAQVS